MSLYVQPLYEDALAEVGGGVGNDRFQRCFINAVNNALDEINDECDLATRHAHINQIDTSISTLDSNRSYILYAGIIYHLIRKGQRPSDPKIAAIVYKDSDRNWDKCKGLYQTKAFNDCQATDSSDITKFGYLEVH